MKDFDFIKHGNCLDQLKWFQVLKKYSSIRLAGYVDRYIKRYIYPITGLDMLLGLQEFEGPRIL